MPGNKNRFSIGSKLAAEESPGRAGDSVTSSRRMRSDRLALMLSIALHLSVAGTVGWLLVANLPDGAGDVDARTGGIVLVDARTEVTEYLSEGEEEPKNNSEQQSAAGAKAARAKAPELLAIQLPGIQSQAMRGRAEGMAEAVAESLAEIGEMDASESGVKKSGGKVTTQVFGVSGTGNKFVYVFDRSDSMSGFEERPIKAARQELLKSLDSLNESNQFQIVFYNKAIEVFSPDSYPRLYYADSEHLKDARRFVKSIRPAGGTDHMKALEWAFRFSPDVIFLLTDAEVEGGFGSGQLAKIAGLNRSKAVINIVEFGTYRGADRSLQKVSESSGGQYVFKNVNSLKLDK
jgi:hypothetical protein